MLTVAKSPLKPAFTASKLRCWTTPAIHRRLSVYRRPMSKLALLRRQDEPDPHDDSPPRQLPEHAVISTFDLFSIGVGPSSSHTVGPMRAGKIFINDLKELGLLKEAKTLKIALYGSLAATGRGHHTPQAILLGLEGSDPETVDCGSIPSRYEAILAHKSLNIGGDHRVRFDIDRDMVWHWDRVLKTHPNGMRFSCFGEDGELLATNEYFSVGGGFVVNEKTKVDENLFYKGVDKRKVHEARLHQTHSLSDPLEDQAYQNPASSNSSSSDAGHHPPYPFSSGETLLALTRKYNMTIAQIVHDNEKYFGWTDDEIHSKIMKIWSVMDECIHTGVSTSEPTLPGRLGLRRRAPILYRRLMRGLYPGVAQPHLPGITAGHRHTPAIKSPKSVEENKNKDDQADSESKWKVYRASRAPRVVGSYDHAVLPMPPRKADIPAMDFLSCYAIAVNEVNASGGRIVTSPTNGASGVIPAVLKYIIEFVSDEPEKSVQTFLLTAAAVGMVFKRASTISAAEGGCQAEVGVACSMASAGFAACMGASPETILQAAEIGIEHNLGLTCDPIDGLVQVPCIERNSLGAVKAVTAAQLSMASEGVYSVTLDEAIEAMRLTAADMSIKYKETSLSGLATSVKIPLTVPAWLQYFVKVLAMLPSALREFAVLHANACSTTLVQLSRLSPCMSRCISTGTPSCRASITGHTQDGLGPPNLASYGFPIDSGKHSAFRRAGSLTPRTGKHNTEVGAELDKRVKALEVAAEAETTALGPPVYSEDDLLALYEDLLALPKVHPKEESRASSEKSRQESDIEHVTALEQRLLQAVQSHPSTSGASNADSNPQLHSRAIAYCRKLIDSSTNIATEANESVPSISDMESLQRLCIEAGDIQSAQVVLNTMKHFELAISEDVINPILRHLASEGKVTELEAVMHEYLTIPTDRQRHFHVKVHLNACSPDVIPTSAIDLLHVYEAQNLPAPMQTYTSAITSLFTTNLHLGRAQAWDLFSHMRYVAHPNPDGVLYTLMIRGCASPVGVRSSEPERALDLWTEMTVDHKIPPTAGSYDAVILACARSGKPAYVGEAFRLAKQMLDSHRDAQGMSAFAPTRRTFCALLEGAKRVGDLGKARWILAEMASDRRRADGTADPEGIHEEIMMHMFHSYASYNAPLRRSAFRLSKPPAPTSNTTIAPLEAESNGLSSQEEITTTQPKTTAFTPAPPQTSEEVVREVQVLFNHILQANAVPTGAESVETDGLPSRQLFKDVRLTPRLLNSYLSVFYKHASLTQFRDLYRDIFERCNVPRTGRAFVEALERCANSRQGEERPLALQFSEEIWAQWQQMENSGLDNGRPLSARTIERAHIAMIRVLALTNKLGQAMQTVRSFASKYPASSVRTPTSKPHIRSTRTALEASRPLVRLTSSVEVPDDHVPPMLMFDDLQLLHHRLLAKGMKAEIGYITYLCKSYEWALRVRRDAAMKLRPMKTSETRITPVTALVE